MDFGHSRRFTTRQAQAACGDLYPGPVLMPRGILRALDPLLAVALRPAGHGGEAFASALERMLRGRPDGPLMLALWSTTAAGEISHRDLRRLAELLPGRLPEHPASREELTAWLRPRAEILARCVLAVAQRNSPEVREPAVRLGCGMGLVRVLADLPRHLAAGRQPLPAADLEAAGCSARELMDAVRTPAVDRLLRSEAAWARELLLAGRPACGGVGARLRRGLRAASLRALLLLRRVDDPRADVFRRPPVLGPAQRWRCAVRALWPLPGENTA